MRGVALTSCLGSIIGAKCVLCTMTRPVDKILLTSQTSAHGRLYSGLGRLEELHWPCCSLAGCIALLSAREHPRLLSTMEELWNNKPTTPHDNDNDATRPQRFVCLPFSRWVVWGREWSAARLGLGSPAPRQIRLAGAPYLLLLSARVLQLLLALSPPPPAQTASSVFPSVCKPVHLVCLLGLVESTHSSAA